MGILAFVPEGDGMVYMMTSSSIISLKPQHEDAEQPHHLDTPPILRNQYNTTVNESYGTNNVSDGWHDRFRQNKVLPRFVVEAAPNMKWNELQTRSVSIVTDCDSTRLEYLRRIAGIVNISYCNHFL